MAKAKRAPVTRDAIRAALRSAAEEYLRRVAALHPGETVYGFLLEMSAEGFSVYEAFDTEENLTRRAERCAADCPDDEDMNTVEKARAFWRWGFADEGWCQPPNAAFDKVNALLDRARDEGLYEEYSDDLEELCVEVLKGMGAAGAFDLGPGGGQIGVGLCFIGGENSPEEFLRWARQVNPQPVYRRLRREYLAGGPE
jgi:hypothetical protein